MVVLELSLDREGGHGHGRVVQGISLSSRRELPTKRSRHLYTQILLFPHQSPSSPTPKRIKTLTVT